MSAAPALAEAMPNLAGVAMLLLGLLVPTRRRRDAAARLVAWQGGLLGAAAATAAWGGGAVSAGPPLWLLAFGALAGRGLLLPALLRLAARPAGGGALSRSAGSALPPLGGDARPSSGGDAIPHPGGNAPPRAGGLAFPQAFGLTLRGTPNAAASLLAGGCLSVLAVAAVIPAGAGVAPGTREGMALALAVLLAGLLTMFLRRDVPFGMLGLLAAENGALLGLVHTCGGALPGAAALAAALSPGLAACLVLAARGGGEGGPFIRALFGGSRR